jgi:uncharacterized protein (TIGR00730 family)
MEKLPNRTIQRLCVFCGASNGARPEYSQGAWALGQALGRAGITLIYGGGRAGLMGAVADAALSVNGKVIGVITKLLEGRELGHTGITELHVVETMHERKMMMANMADAFIALPGGLGTMDEMFEILAWAQLGIHAKPVGLLNTAGFYDPLWKFIDQMERESFLRLDLHATLLVDHDPSILLSKLKDAGPPKPARPTIVESR